MLSIVLAWRRLQPRFFANIFHELIKRLEQSVKVEPLSRRT